MGKKSTSNIDVDVGLRVKIACKQKGITQAALAESIGVSFQQIQKYQAGRNRISSSRLKSISEKLGKPIAWFFGDDVPKPGADAIAQMLALPHGLDLAYAYISITDNKDRNTVLQVARGLAGSNTRREP